MKVARNVLLLLGVVAVIGAGILAITMFGKDDPEDAPPVAEEIVYMSTDGVTANIERRLLRSSGYAVDVSCPKKVDSAVGTTFRCKVRFQGEKQVRSFANVTIDGPTGDFTWKSVPVSEPSETPDVATVG